MSDRQVKAAALVEERLRDVWRKPDEDPPAVHGYPGRKCYVCNSDAWWRLDAQHPWVCGVCHPCNGVVA